MKNIIRTSLNCCFLAWVMTFAVAAIGQTASITVDCGISKGILFRSEGYNNVAGVNTGAATRDADYAFMVSQGLKAKVLRVWVSESLYNTSTGVYNFSQYTDYLNDVSNYFADTILVCIPGATMVESWKYTPDQCKPILKNIISYLKANYPKIKYIEGLNEPDLFNSTLMTSDKVYSYYKAFSDAVREVNATLNPAVPLQVGGPAITSFKYASNWIYKFLDGYENDTDPNKKLDFLSFHCYSYKNEPKEIAAIASSLDGSLTNRGIPTTIPYFITETGLFPGSATSGTEEDDALRQAAGMAAYTYWMLQNSKMVQFQWVLRHGNGELRKDQMVTRPVSYSNKLTPYGNMMKMMSMMKTDRKYAETNVMNVDGIGVYGLASADASGVSVLAANYQHTNTNDYYTTIDVKNLPSNFNGMNIRKKVYRIDQSTSNNFFNLTNANLQLVTDTVLSNPGTAISIPLGIMTENSIQLVLLEPVVAPAAAPIQLTAIPHFSGASLNWSTQSENGSTQFEVLRSADGTSYSVIGTVSAAGNASTITNYSFVDANVLGGINYYQVRLLHQNSTTISSNVATFFINQQEGATDIYYSFGSTGVENGNVTSGVPAGWSASPVTRSNFNGSYTMFSSTSPSNSYTGASGEGNATTSSKKGSLLGRTVNYGTAVTIPASPITDLSYYEVTITPSANEAVKIMGISVGSRSIGSAGGPANVVFRTSIDNFASNVYSKDVNTSASWGLLSANFDNPLTAPAGVPVTIRLYANDAVGSTNGDNNWRIDDLTIRVQYTAPLLIHPVTAEVTATSTVKVYWQTPSEQNVTSYDVLRSADGNTYTIAGQVAAVGNSSSLSSYFFTDASPLPGINYYKIRQNAGTTNISNAVSVFIVQGTTNGIYYSFGNAGAETGWPVSGIPAGWYGGIVTVGNSDRTSDFFTSTSPSNAYNTASGSGNAVLIARQGSLNGRTVTYTTTTTIPATSIDALSYFEVKIKPTATEQVKIKSIGFGSRSIGSSGGPASVVIRTSVDNFSSNVFMQDINAASSWVSVIASFSTPITGAVGDTVTIRIYANDAVGGTANNWRIDDLIINVVNAAPSALPVSLTGFTAAVQQKAVLLNWTTVFEQNSSRFEIQRSFNGVDFATIGSVAAKGNSTTMQLYKWVDVNPVNGVNYYRLKQIDADGAHKIYGPLAVKLHVSSADVRVHATTSTVNVNIMADKAGKVNLLLFDAAGNRVAVKTVSVQPGNNNLAMPVNNAAGIYILNVQGEGINISRKFIKP